MIDQAITNYMKTHGVPGCSVALGSGSRITFAKGFGQASPDVNADEATIYRIGSVSKQFTAALVLLAATGALPDVAPLDLDAGVRGFFPDSSLPDGMTVRHLLNHSSGLWSYTDDERFRDGQVAPASTEDMLGRIFSRPQTAPPGNKGYYNNSNYYLLAEILERHSGRLFQRLMRKAILAPLGMDATGFFTEYPLEKQEAQGSDGKGFTDKRTHPSWIRGAGDLQSNVLDMAKWNMAFLRADLLSGPAMALMLKSAHDNPQPAVDGERLAMGWMDISTKDARRFYHQGFVYGYSSMNYVEPDALDGEGKFVTILCNRFVVQGLPDLADTLADTITGSDPH